MPSWPPRERRPMRPRRRNKSQNDWARRTGEVAWERFDGGEACPHPLQSSGSETSVMETRPVGGAAHVGLRPAVEPLAAPPSGRCQALPLPPQSPQNPRPTVVLGTGEDVQNERPPRQLGPVHSWRPLLHTLRSGRCLHPRARLLRTCLGELASQAKKALAAKLPLDVLTIESGDEGLAGARLEVGKYLTDKLYLGYSGRLGSPQNQSTTRRENANSVRLE